MINILDSKSIPLEKILQRENNGNNVSDIVSEIISVVRKDGDSALKMYCEKFDRASIDTLEVSDAEMDEAFNLVEDEYIEIIKEAKKNIYAFHEKQKRNSFVINENDGVVLGQKVMPLRRVGLYVPGGTASYPSSVLMNTIPAKIAGCKEIVMTTPPMSNGKINPVILVVIRYIKLAEHRLLQRLHTEQKQ